MGVSAAPNPCMRHVGSTLALTLLCSCAGSNEQRHSWKQLSPDGVLISEGGWLEHHVREMCSALRPEASQSPQRGVL